MTNDEFLVMARNLATGRLSPSKAAAEEFLSHANGLVYYAEMAMASTLGTVTPQAGPSEHGYHEAQGKPANEARDDGNIYNDDGTIMVKVGRRLDNDGPPRNSAWGRVTDG